MPSKYTVGCTVKMLLFSTEVCRSALPPGLFTTSPCARYSTKASMAASLAAALAASAKASMAASLAAALAAASLAAASLAGVARAAA
ncbi:hypothetical protein TSOC_002658 [Tetrabaena socialis]|uniref:Uncharacterized protein n=1 Tax=Tetrabaena socialis TaxID=47790 RepID=A0A2J8ADL0_9CHLO|nr:hypothetical protein TSOC_002658 [Tetrabaena socialis]|eukprot:PNH10610.1 hypothetical protein TSOC_002658 [Tetrabaena socialis]